jgi:hypothetical protein
VRRVLLLCSLAAALAVACSAGSKSSTGKKIATGLYAASNYQAGADTCNGGNFDATLYDWPIYVNGGTVNFDDGLAIGSNQSATGFHLTATFPYHHQRINNGQLFCTEVDSVDVTGTSTGKGGIDVTYVQHWANGGGTQCSPALLGYTLPCDATETFHLQLNGDPSPASPLVVDVTGSLTANSDVAPLTDAQSGTAQGMSLTYDGALGGVAVTSTGANAWYCNAALASNGYLNYSVYEVNQRQLYVLVATNQWIVGDHAIDPDSTVYVELGNQVDRLGWGVSGALHLSTAGTIQDTPGNDCQFSLTGVSLTGIAQPAAFATQSSRSEARATALRSSAKKPKSR